MISFEPLFATMKEKNISGYTLCKKMGFPASNYYKIKKGTPISTYTVNNLCKLLGVGVDSIMVYIEEENE